MNGSNERLTPAAHAFRPAKAAPGSGSGKQAGSKPAIGGGTDGGEFIIREVRRAAVVAAAEEDDDDFVPDL